MILVSNPITEKTKPPIIIIIMITLAGQNGVLRLLGLFIDNKLTYICLYYQNIVKRTQAERQASFRP